MRHSAKVLIGGPPKEFPKPKPPVVQKRPVFSSIVTAVHASVAGFVLAGEADVEPGPFQVGSYTSVAKHLPKLAASSHSELKNVSLSDGAAAGFWPALVALW